MKGWLFYAGLAVICWGVVGLLQKLGTNRISSQSLMVWLLVGFALLLPWLWHGGDVLQINKQDAAIGLLSGVTNGLGSWFLFLALERGAKASIAVPLTALYPLVTIVFANLFLAERLTALQWVGIALAIIAAAMLSYETDSASAFASERSCV
ncbi:MAG: DMT family transporter [Pyrinomonadaceae bacterium]